MQTIERLPTEIKYKGFIYRLIERTEDKSIYAQWSGGGIVAYEVFKTKIIDNHKNKKYLDKLNGTNTNLDTVPALKERFPNDEEFGTRAWTYRTLEEAKGRYHNI